MDQRREVVDEKKVDTDMMLNLETVEASLSTPAPPHFHITPTSLSSHILAS